MKKYPKIDAQIAFLTRVAEVGEDQLEWRSYPADADLATIDATPWVLLTVDQPKWRSDRIVEMRAALHPTRLPAAQLPQEDASGEYKVEISLTHGKMVRRRVVLRFATEDHARSTLFAMLAREDV